MATRSSYNKKSSAIKRILSEAKELAPSAPLVPFQLDAATIAAAGLSLEPSPPSTTSSDPLSSPRDQKQTIFLRDHLAAPLETNLFEWHFTLLGPPGTEFERGIYHGRITLPPQYPMMAPDLVMLTPNGRWEMNKKVRITLAHQRIHNTEANRHHDSALCYRSASLLQATIKNHGNQPGVFARRSSDYKLSCQLNKKPPSGSVHSTSHLKSGETSRKPAERGRVLPALGGNVTWPC